MTSIDGERLQLALHTHPGCHYVLLDGAAIRQLPALLARLDLPYYCLYRGAQAHLLRDVAPYLVRLDAAGSFLRCYAKMGWGASWGVFCTSGAGLQTLRRHCRRLLQLRDAQRRLLQFRYYDPRVLRVFLSHSEPAQLAEFFGPVTCFFSESPADGQLIRWQLQAGSLQRTPLSVAPTAGTAGAVC